MTSDFHFMHKHPSHFIKHVETLFFNSTLCDEGYVGTV